MVEYGFRDIRCYSLHYSSFLCKNFSFLCKNAPSISLIHEKQREILVEKMLLVKNIFQTFLVPIISEKSCKKISKTRNVLVVRIGIVELDLQQKTILLYFRKFFHEVLLNITCHCFMNFTILHMTLLTFIYRRGQNYGHSNQL